MATFPWSPEYAQALTAPSKPAQPSKPANNLKSPPPSNPKPAPPNNTPVQPARKIEQYQLGGANDLKEKARTENEK
ncbi:hypothetical protein MMC30_005216 [Trapelia coarctata]|nr:hypothetical protein [Trapelia coarctata]